MHVNVLIIREIRNKNDQKLERFYYMMGSKGGYLSNSTFILPKVVPNKNSSMVPLKGST